MNVLCAICQDLLESSHDVFVTPCGHVFHFPCLIQWLEKSQSCPQCRQVTRKDRITRIYFTASNTDVIKEDSCTLQQKVDSLSFQIELRKKELSNCREENGTLKKQNTGLRDEVKKNESVINEKNAVIRAMKEQNQYYKQQVCDYDKLKGEKSELQRRMDLYENVKSLLIGSADEVDQLLSRNSDPVTLATYVGIMKRELETSLIKRKELRNNVKRLQHDLQTVKIKRNSFTDDYLKRIDELEEELKICRRERDEYRVQLVESRKESEIKDDEQEIINLIDSPPSRKRETDIVPDFDELMPKRMKKSILNKAHSVSSTVKTKENEENSPYLPTKSKSIIALKEQPGQRGSLTIQAKRPTVSSKFVPSKSRLDKGETYDGFGGHSKVETFPVPRSSPNKLKRSLSELPKSKKLKLDLGKSKPINEYYTSLI